LKTIISMVEGAEEILAAVNANDKYCPCKIIKTPDTKCMCKEFREQKEGICHCGLFIKEIKED